MKPVDRLQNPALSRPEQHSFFKDTPQLQVSGGDSAQDNPLTYKQSCRKSPIGCVVIRRGDASEERMKFFSLALRSSIANCPPAPCQDFRVLKSTKHPVSPSTYPKPDPVLALEIQRERRLLPLSASCLDTCRHTFPQKGTLISRDVPC